MSQAQGGGITSVAFFNNLEVRVIRKTGFLRGFFMMFNIFTTRMALFCTLFAYSFAGNKLSGEKVYVVVTYLSIISLSMTALFVRGLAEIAECLVSVKRIQSFMMNEEINVSDYSNGIGADPLPKDLCLKAVDVNGTWSASSSDTVLKSINLTISAGQVVGIVGAVGSGKTSLLNLFLREVLIQSGSLQVSGSISYAAQDPWIFGGTVRQNILFGLPYESKRYKEVIHACCLERDLDLFPNGDSTLIGDRGASLSGGQRARINLARVALEVKTEIPAPPSPNSLLLSGFLRGKTVILATHQLQFMKNLDYVVRMENGSITDQGAYAVFSAEHFTNIPKEFKHFTTLAVPDATDYMGDRKPSISHLFKAPSTIGDDDVSIIEEEPVANQKEIESHFSYKGSTFLGYLGAASSWFSWGFVAILVLLSQLTGSLCDNWVAYWTNQDEMTPSTSVPTEMDSYKIVYTAAVATLLIAALTRGLLFYSLSAKASKGLHRSMVQSVTGAKMSFFHKNPSGAILNRFSKDLGATDELFPKALLDLSQGVGQVLGSIVTSMIVSAWLIIPISGFTVITLLIRRYYIKTSKNLKRLENMSRSPVYSHLNTSLQGMSTIRAHGSQNYLKSQFDLHQDLNISCSFTFISAQQAYSYYLDVVGLIYLTIVVMCFIFVQSDTASNVGLAITQTMGVTVFLQWVMKQSSDLVTLMTSVERLLAFTSLPQEETAKESNMSHSIQYPGWPNEGRIEFKEMSLWYEENEPPVINNLNLQIKQGEKIGIVGRTGAGKSSLIAAIFRLADVEGQIYIDDIDTKSVPLSVLRSRISIIPQDPILFFGNLRRNLDPFDRYPDYLLWKALDDVELREVFSEGAGLETRIQEGGSNLSVGQRQLVCLARAIVENNKIIVLDEATANVDHKTDELIQSTIKKNFKKCTVLTIAHRLHTVMDSDQIVVMDAGLMVEFGAPYLLLQIQGGFLYNLVQETGASMAAQLQDVAEKQWRKQQSS